MLQLGAFGENFEINDIRGINALFTGTEASTKTQMKWIKTFKFEKLCGEYKSRVSLPPRAIKSSKECSESRSLSAPGRQSRSARRSGWPK
jgi:hypothetical protein